MTETKLRLDRDVLVRLGYGALGPDDTAALLARMYDELQQRVGARLVGSLTDAQLEEFETLVELDDGRAGPWLELHCPRHRELVRAEYDALLAEAAQRANAVVSLLVGDVAP